MGSQRQERTIHKWVLAFTIFLTITTATSASAHNRWDTEQRRHAQIIHKVFGSHGAAAVRVASCESHLRTWARNGQYLGLFQMGSYARSRFGHGPGAWKQARAAHAYFVASGRDWSPWECKPWR